MEMMTPVNLVHLARKPLVREPVPDVEQDQHDKIKPDLSYEHEMAQTRIWGT
jgi:hypothetical protein